MLLPFAAHIRLSVLRTLVIQSGIGIQDGISHIQAHELVNGSQIPAHFISVYLPVSVIIAVTGHAGVAHILIVVLELRSIVLHLVIHIFRPLHSCSKRITRTCRAQPPLLTRIIKAIQRLVISPVPSGRDTPVLIPPAVILVLVFHTPSCLKGSIGWVGVIYALNRALLYGHHRACRTRFEVFTLLGITQDMQFSIFRIHESLPQIGLHFVCNRMLFVIILIHEHG